MVVKKEGGGCMNERFWLERLRERRYTAALKKLA